MTTANGELVGILTEGDLLRRVETTTERHRPRWPKFLMGPGHLAKEYVHTHSRKVDNVITGHVVSVTWDTPLSEIIAVRRVLETRSPPIVDWDRDPCVAAARPADHGGRDCM